ncbi:PREDICTED: alpha-endosulfine [Charadrius vociferus]|uniref:alpha-endosulfine n=1 Tax=Charadrius vociferus TaxID=50402 RepID=UPI000521412C|nr:PREDICTED: alpha-endosulfine [Charadrius vociferus]
MDQTLAEEGLCSPGAPSAPTSPAAPRGSLLHAQVLPLSCLGSADSPAEHDDVFRGQGSGQEAGSGGTRPGTQAEPQPSPAAAAFSPTPATSEQEKQKETITPERAEEAKLKAKYPNLGQKPGGSDFLMKRLQKGQKYFDSGDYNMAKAKMKNKQLPSAGPDKNLVTGDHIPTPQDLPQRKSSLVTSKLAG